MTITFLNENYELKFHKIKYEQRSGQSKLGLKIFFKFIYTIFSLLFYYKKPIKNYFTFIHSIVFNFYSIFDTRYFFKEILQIKTVLLFNFNFLTVILIFIIDRINKLK